MNKEQRESAPKSRKSVGGLAGWLLARLRVTRNAPRRLAVLERIALAPRQSLALIDAEGRRFLVATSPEGTPAFYALDDTSQRQATRNVPGLKPALAPMSRQHFARVSW